MLETLTRLRHARLRDVLSGLMVSLVLFGCALRKPGGPIPVKEMPAPQQSLSRPLIIVLPGRGDDLDDLAASGMAAAVQQAWPQADVLLAGVTLSYVAEGKVAERLHDEIIEPARRRGYHEIWLTGASLGGMNALLYERRYPREVTGLVLYAPFMGPPSLIRKIADAGGPAVWDPGPLPTAVDKDNYAIEMWRVVKTSPDRIWLACGDQDRFIEAAKLIGAVLPPGHFIQGQGGHEWPVWDRGATDVFTRIAASHP